LIIAPQLRHYITMVSMPTYFKAPRRKIGLATLLMACLFAVGWVRSCTEADVVSYASGRYSTHVWFSIRSQTGLMRDWNEPEEFAKKHPDLKLAEAGPFFPTWSKLPSQTIDLSSAMWMPRRFGFNIAEGHTDDGNRWAVFSAPYGAIVIPLTVLSACLLLSKPRTPKVKSAP
jgi:hypothetical protein